MSLIKMRKRQKASPAAKEFKRPPSRGRAVLLAVVAVVLAAAAIWLYVDGNTAFAGLVLVGAVAASAMSYNHWRRLREAE